MRLQKFLASSGVASRRHCEAIIASGRVRVNGCVVQQMGTNVDPETDVIEVDGKRIQPAPQLVYYMLNKPAGYLTTASDQRGRKTVFDLFGGIEQRVVPVGRLDMDSEGLLILTNDGELTHRLMHPSFRVEKEYFVRVEGMLTSRSAQQLRDGVMIDGGLACAAAVKILNSGESESTAQITITEGRKRQVRYMFGEIGHPVKELRRIREGTLKLGLLRPGKYRELTNTEIHELRHEVSLE